MSLERFAQLFKDTIGLEAESIGTPTLACAVKQRQNACGIRDMSAYWGHVQASDDERQTLIETIVVQETWFFRDPRVFDALTTRVVPEWRQAHPNRVMRVLSAPCSSGEEPYSIAMALHDAAFPAHLIRIDAVDVSRAALRKARLGVYGPNSFRGTDFRFRDRFFEPVPGGHRLLDSIRRPVRFRQGNVLAPSFGAAADAYDVIFCRNLLIYFDRPTQERTIALLERLLAADGLLVVGSSEGGAFLKQAFEPAGVGTSCVFRRRSAVGPTPAHADGGGLRHSGKDDYLPRPLNFDSLEAMLESHRRSPRNAASIS